jgi:hypothetical protein
MATGNAMHHAIPVRDTGATPNPDLEMVKRFAGYGAELAGLKALCAGDVLNLVISDRRARRRRPSSTENGHADATLIPRTSRAC